MALPAWRRYRWWPQHCWRQRLLLTMANSGPFSARTLTGPIIFLLYFALLFSSVSGNPDAPHITAIAGDKITLNCDVNFPNGVVSPYVVQWWRKGAEVPFYIWYDDYPEHASQDYKGRVSKVSPGGQYGLASLNISHVKDTDRGWYNCKVLFLNREPNNAVNGTWYFVEVQAKPRFEHHPDPVVYVNLQDSTVLACTAIGNPPPEILWFKGKAPIKENSRVAVVNGNTELRISHIRDSDLDEYTCLARNGVDNISFTTRVVQAGAAVIVRPPENQTVLENAEVRIPCQGQAEPANLTVRWFKDGIPVHKMGTLGQRTSILSDGTLQIRLITAEDNGWYTCEITNGIGRSITERAYINIEYPARVVFTPTVQYIPRGLKGIIKCQTDANPPITYITWKKDSRLFDPFNTAGIMALLNGSLLIDQVSQQHAGQYQCQPFSQRGSAGPSPIIQVIIKDPPTLLSRPNAEYIKNVGASVSFSCQAAGTPTPEIRWRRVDGLKLPERRISFLGGEMTLSDLRKSDHGVYECVVSNEVATIVARTALLIERTTPHAPTNVTVTSSETFAVTIEWNPGYSGCSSCQQTYKIRYRETDSKSSNWNWIELPVNPPDARKVKIHNLTPRTKYEFQVIGMNEFGDGMYSEIIEAQTKDCIEFNINIRPGTSQTDGDGSGNITYFDIRLLPRDDAGNILFPQIPKSRDVPPGERPPAATNLTLTQEAGGWVLRWKGPKEPDPNLLYYTIEKKKDSQGETWKRFAEYIDVEEASYMMKNMGAAKAYLFRVLSHSATSYSISKELKYDLPENVKRRAVTAGLIGGILFFIVAIVLSVCTVKICNKRRRRKHDQAVNEIQRQSVPTYNTMVARRVSETRNGGTVTQVPLKRSGKNGIPVVSDSGSLRRGLLSLFDTVSHCVVSLKDKVDQNSGFYHENNLYYADNYDSDELDYSGGLRRKQKLRPTLGKRAYYKISVEYPTQPGYGVNRGPQAAKGGYISRSKDGKFVLEEETDEGGFEMELPPNRFRTRSVAIVAGYSPERLYSNMPPGAFVVESGVYKVGADREWERPEPIYWKQVVFGARSGSDGSGSMPRRRVGRLVEEDIQRLRAMESPSKPSRLLRQDNLELKRQSGSTARLRASSPLDQEAPLIEFQSPGSEISTVPHPTSLDKSMPSTLLTQSTRGLSSISSPNFTGEASSSRSLRQKSSAEMTPLGTIPEQSYGELEYPPPRSIVKADVHRQQDFARSAPRLLHHQQPHQLLGAIRPPPLNRREREELERQLYWERTTYRNADALFPNYALNYPAPIHHHPGYQGSISPSIQYPEVMPPRYEEALLMPQVPLATSSPPIDRSQPVIGSQHSLGLPFATSTRTSLHDYENMRYPSAAVRKRRTAGSRPTSDEVGRLHRDSTVIDGELLLKKNHHADAVSLVSEVLDAEVTALTNSSPGSSNGSTERSSKSSTKAILQHAKRNLEEGVTQDRSTSSSGIASKNSSQDQTASSSGSTSAAAQQPLSIDTSKTGLEPIPEGTHMYYYYDNLPFYENWPPPKQFPPQVRPRMLLNYQFVPPPDAVSAQLLPPLTPHQSLGQVAKPQARPSSATEQRNSPGAADTSLDTPPSNVGLAHGGSRPGSAHSAPLLDLSIDRHYEFDAARTPTDDIGLHSEGNQPLLLLPQNWNRPYLGYNPRRDRELGAAAAAANRERVFSDSEIYSPVFPRGRPEPRVDITARVLAMKKEFAEYKLQLKEQQCKLDSSAQDPDLKKKSPDPAPSDIKVSETTRISPPTPASRMLPKDSAAERLESLI